MSCAGPWILYSTLHFSSLARASSTDQNNSTLRHSSRRRPVEALDIAVLYRLARSNEVQLNSVTMRPGIHNSAADLAAVVHGD